MKSLVLTVALIGICFSPHAICAETHTTISKQDRIAIDTIASKFADRLTASDAKGVVAVFANSSPLMSDVRSPVGGRAEYEVFDRVFTDLVLL